MAGGGGGLPHTSSNRQMGIAAGWGRIFKTGLTIMRLTLMGLTIMGLTLMTLTTLNILYNFFGLDNWALLYAQRIALQQEVPLFVCFCLPSKFLDTTYRQYSFMIKGLQEVEKVQNKIVTSLGQAALPFCLSWATPCSS